MSTPDGVTIERAHCNACARTTKHARVAERITRGSELVDGQYDISWSDTYVMLECLGCESVCLRHASWFSEDPGDTTIRYYPPRVSRAHPRWSYELPTAIQDLLSEVYAALHADSRRLAVMGARAIIDIVLQDKVGDIGSFERKLDALVDKGYISKINRATLAAALDVGHAASHRGHAASVEEVAHVMDIVENLLQTDVLSAAAAKLASKTPKRPLKPSNDGTAV